MSQDGETARDRGLRAMETLAGLLAPHGFAHAVDAPTMAEGEWMLDLKRDGYWTCVAWRHDKGYGIFHDEEPHYGAVAPDEVHPDAAAAASRVLELAPRARPAS